MITFTFTFGASGLSHPALRPIQSDPMCIPDITKGYENLFEVLANRKRVADFTLRNSSSSMR